MKKYDVVIPCAPKDYETLEYCVKGVKCYCEGSDNIYIISKDDQNIEGTKWINENKFPFSKEAIKDINNIIKFERTGWYLQQLINFYCFDVIDGIKDDVLILDSDNIFLNKTSFFQDNKTCFNISDEGWLPYFEHMKRLDPSFDRVITHGSGNCHHGMWNRHIVKEIMDIVINRHKDDFWKVVIAEVQNMADGSYNQSGCADYEIYINYIFKFHPELCTLRMLKWTNEGRMSRLQAYKNEGYNYVACQAYYEWSRDLK